ncbi:hypothetical protein NXS19_010584 [Fusarium pseudograminearum]|uniref:Uncharacterized protein n=1 Tax=Fusarium pseudograminearum (strain CS3096) TaxID=1028729 RepID=K3VVG5_FUSPC|nr:hypothetical protein FPSE_01365 [Fusarium pseudograminearum CS3096]EKJ78438.1 hypothetical protein FPSE_01365 [Fusarium pseudograminearum CS3096]KAF0639638.1 hypothetical protein FPSE5266_01365 [Fusarium pseudograminearum]UZP42768.1 hypothetical protein NXS19_010584 [Fusarium pseudograminearum]
MKVATIALFLLGTVAAAPSDKGTDKPAGLNTTAVVNKASCSIACNFWYSKCYYRPWAYTCDDRGNFVRRGWNPDCDEHCWCKCDAKA